MYLILVGGVVSTIKEGRNGLCLVKNKNSQETDRTILKEQCQSLFVLNLLRQLNSNCNKVLHNITVKLHAI